MLPVPDKYLDEARRILASFTDGEFVSPPVPDESQALVRPGLFCREMARHVLSTPSDEPERAVRRAAYYLMTAAALYPGAARAVPEGIALTHQGAWEFAVGEVAASV